MGMSAISESKLNVNSLEIPSCVVEGEIQGSLSLEFENCKLKDKVDFLSSSFDPCFTIVPFEDVLMGDIGKLSDRSIEKQNNSIYT